MAQTSRFKFIVCNIFCIMIGASISIILRWDVGEENFERKEQDSGSLHFPPKVKKILLNIGPNISPVRPIRSDLDTASLVVEPNIAIANYIRQKFKKDLKTSKMFVLSCAVSGPPFSGKIATFRHYNNHGLSSSLSEAKLNRSNLLPRWANRSTFITDDEFDPGSSGIQFVPTISLETLITSIPENIVIPFMLTDTQGHDLSVVKSASIKSLRRIYKIKSEVYLGSTEAPYEGVRNNLLDWVDYMKQAGYKLANEPPREIQEWDAEWIRQD